MLSLPFALALMIAPAPATSAPTPGAAAADTAPVTRETASALARTVAPSDLMIPLELDQARKGILSLPKIDEDSRELEADYPGIWAAVWAATEPEMRKSVSDAFPKYWDSLEQLYRSRLTESEAQAILTFYRSETGQRLLRGMLNAVDATPLVADMVKSPDAPVSAAQMKAVTDSAKSKALEELKPGDTLEFLALMHFVDLEKFKALGAETQNVTLDWVNHEDPEADARLQAVMEKAMKQYMADHPTKK